MGTILIAAGVAAEAGAAAGVVAAPGATAGASAALGVTGGAAPGASAALRPARSFERLR